MRSKAILTLLSGLLILKTGWSQTNELLVQGQTGKLYLEHTVIARENWYSVGRLYNIDPKVLAAFNHLALTKPLIIGQELQVPLAAANFSQTGQKAPGMTLVPVYHIIQDKEWLYRISVNHNKVPVTSLEKWNNTDKDHARAGMHLIVGFLKVKTSLSALAKPALQASAEGQTAAATAPLPTPQNTSSTGTQIPAKTVANVPPPPVANPSTTTPQNTNPSHPPANTGTTTGSSNPASSASSLSSNSKPVVTTPVVTTPAPAAHFNGGFFRSDYGDTGKSLSGLAGVFKSTSGWQDGKYYALMNNVPVGTIVKVTDPGSGKSVYTKVLGVLPDMKESAGLSIRISNAAAGELGQGEDRFQVDVKY